MWGNTVAIHNVFKEKKIKKNNFGKKTQKMKKEE